MKPKPKGHPFLELFSGALQEDFRFPILEIFVFLYALSTFALASVSFSLLPSSNSEQAAFSLAVSIIGTPLLFFVVLIMKNVAYGLGGDLEKGTLQAYLTYPITRRGIITAKLLSAIGLSLAMFVGLQALGLAILAPGLLSSQLPVFVLTYLADLAYPLLLAAIILVMALFLRRGGISLVVGFVLYFALSIVQSIIILLALVLKTSLPLQILSVFNPATALESHYGLIGGILGGQPWTPSLNDVYLFIATGYIMVAAAYSLAYYIFDRRLGL